MPGLGNIAYDCECNQLFVTNMEDGKIYRLSMGGTTLSTFDHATPDNGLPGFAPPGEKVWGIGVYNHRVYYGVWGGGANGVWSKGLSSNCDFDAQPAVFEIAIPLRPGHRRH